MLRNELVMHEERQMKENETKKKVFLTDQPDYEDRVRGLLIEMENMNKQHQINLAETRDLLI